ncbi:glycosyltransferase family 2 protein [Aestuariivirga sp.]|uniref:glycosyltransferase family 2 protein n=1 Tax=Aestuariivirga sp. TaxID=2650926 RepID=UPI0035B1B09A
MRNHEMREFLTGMTENRPLTAQAVCLWGQDLEGDVAAIDRWRADGEDRRLYAICLEGAEPPQGMAFDRVIRLPFGREQAALAEAIGLQLCFNEGCHLVGSLRSLAAAEIEDASRHFGLLATGKADAILIAADDPSTSRLFLSSYAAFLASFWGALGGDLAAYRRRVASVLLGLAGRTGVLAQGPGAGYATLERWEPAQLEPIADEVRRKLGLFVGTRRLPMAKPVRRVAVVTPYYKEPDEEMRRMLASVAAQTMPCHHIVVSDGFPNPLASAPGVTHIALGAAHADNGNTPRYVGALAALALGYDAVAFLDADNWFEPKHIERLVEAQGKGGLGAVFSSRNVFLPDGTKVQGKFDDDRPGIHADTSCMLITRECEYALHLWGQMPQEWGPACDRVVVSELNGQRIAWTTNRTLNFKSQYVFHYEMAGRPVPKDARKVPTGLALAFRDMPAWYRERSVNCTGRIIALNRSGPFRALKDDG